MRVDPCQCLQLHGLALLLLLHLEQQSAVDVGQDTSEGDGGADERVEFLVSADGELQVARCDALDLEILCGVLRGVSGYGAEGASRPRQELTPASSSTSAVRYSRTAVT